MNRSTSTSCTWLPNSNCGHVNYLCESQKCNFTRTVLECLDDDGFVNYIQLTYCHLQSEYSGTIFLLLLLLILFYAIGTNADDFLCPLLISISKSLKLSDNIAGVTFLAFGNGSPDIFSSIIGITDANPNLVIGQLYGAGIFVTTVVVGSILIHCRFEIMHRPLLRDIVFYLITTALVWTTFFTGKILLLHSILFITVYFIYVAVVIVSGYLYKRNRKLQMASKWPMNRVMPRDSLRRQTKYKLNHHISNDSVTNNIPEEIDADEGIVLRRIKYRRYCQNPLQQRRLTLYNISSEQNERRASNESGNSNGNVYSISVRIKDLDSNLASTDNNNNNLKSLANWMGTEPNRMSTRRYTISDASFASIAHSSMVVTNGGVNAEVHNKKKLDIQMVLEKIRNFWYEPDPVVVVSDEKNFTATDASKWYHKILLETIRIDPELFQEIGILSKINMLIKAPIYLIYTLTIPVVDHELPLNGWNRTLNLAHIILAPQVCLMITQLKFMEPYQLHLATLALSTIIFLVVMFTSHSDRVPSYHIGFAYFGFIVSISWIYSIANEVVNILNAFRVIFDLSKFMIGLTIGAWGNSVGDFLSNLSMARNGFPRMAISACFGGPVLNMLLGIGIPYTILFIKKQTYEISVEYNNMITVLYATITISLVTTMVTLIFATKFHSTRWHGFVLYAIYVCFLFAAIITELKLI